MALNKRVKEDGGLFTSKEVIPYSEMFAHLGRCREKTFWQKFIDWF